jgi:hypothetical protein
MMKSFTKIVGIVIALFFLTSLPSKPAHAVSADDFASQFENYPIAQLWEQYCNDRKGDVINLQTWYSGKCTGDPLDPQSIGFSDIVLLDFYTLLQGEPGQDIGQGSGGALPFLGSAIAAIYQNPPASSVDYIAHVRSNLASKSIVQPAYAQGVGYGFQGLSPVLPLWRAFRNVVYALFILAFVFYGFLIMFRFKVGSQAAITVQSALPQIVVTLLLVAFSYAIAGFLIDLMYVVIGLIIGILVNEGFADSLIGQTWGVGSVSLIEIFLRFMGHAIFGLINNLIIALTGLEGTWLTIANLAFAGIFGLFFAIFILLVALYILGKTLFLLLGAMVNVLLLTIFSPFILLMGIIPGRKAFSAWVQNIIANLSVFPAVIMMFAFSFIFLGDYKTSFDLFGIDVNLGGFTSKIGRELGVVGQFHLPEGVEENDIIAIPIVGASRSARPVLAMFGFGFFVMTPKIAEQIRKALQVGPGLESGLFEPLQTPYGVAPSSLPGTGFLSRGYGLARGLTGRSIGYQPKEQPTQYQAEAKRQPPQASSKPPEPTN